MVLQGEERYAILEFKIRCLFLSVPIGCKCSDRTASACRSYFSRKAWISSRVEAMLFVISSATSQNCCWLASMSSSAMVVSKFCSRKRDVNV